MYVFSKETCINIRPYNSYFIHWWWNKTQKAFAKYIVNICQNFQRKALIWWAITLKVMKKGKAVNKRFKKDYIRFCPLMPWVRLMILEACSKLKSKHTLGRIKQRCQNCSRLTTKVLEKCSLHCFDVSVINTKLFWQLVLFFLVVRSMAKDMSWNMKFMGWILHRTCSKLTEKDSTATSVYLLLHRSWLVSVTWCSWISFVPFNFG